MDDRIIESLTPHLAEGIARSVFGASDLASIEMCLPVFRGGRDLFFFFIAIFRRGASLLFGADKNYTELHELSDAEFDALASRMRLMGVRCYRTTRDGGDDDGGATPCGNNMSELASSRQDMQVDRYRLSVTDVDSVVHTMWFSLRFAGPDFARCGSSAGILFGGRL